MWQGLSPEHLPPSALCHPHWGDTVQVPRVWEGLQTQVTPPAAPAGSQLRACEHLTVVRPSPTARLVLQKGIHTGGENPFRAKNVGKVFFGQLFRHMSSHIGEKPCECSECKEAFSCCSALPRHQRICTREKCAKVCHQCVHLCQHQRTYRQDILNITTEDSL